MSCARSQTTSPSIGVHIRTCGSAIARENPRSTSISTPLHSIAPTAIAATHAPKGCARHPNAAAFTGTRITATQSCTQTGSRR